MAKLMWTFDIRPLKNGMLDGNNNKYHNPREYAGDMQTAYTDGFVFAPRPFRASFTVRSARHREIIEREYKQAREFLSKYE